MKLFISQPMNGKSDEEIIHERNSIIDLIKTKFGQDTEIIDSFVQGVPYNAKPLWYLGKSIELMSEADVAFFARGWADVRGCYIENQCALEYNIPAYYI